jgi:hypothetical protein
MKMGKSATEAKNKYNAANYTQVKVAVNPEVAAAFKAACQADQVSMAGELSDFMASRCGRPPAQGKVKTDLLTSRGGRRKMLAALIGQLEEIKEAESRYCDAIPQNLRSSQRYDNAQQSITAMEEALDALYTAY